MTLNPERNPVPTTLVTPGFRLHRQRPSDNPKDYDAVMASKALLRTWSDSPGPRTTSACSRTPRTSLDISKTLGVTWPTASASLPLTKAASSVRSTSTRSRPL